MNVSLDVQRSGPSILWIGDTSYEVRTQADVLGQTKRLQIGNGPGQVSGENYNLFIEQLTSSSLPMGVTDSYREAERKNE